MYPAPTVEQLSLFTGRSVESFGPFAEQALDQSAFLFQVVTEIETVPVDAGDAKLALHAVLQMADALYLEQQYTEVKAKPFSSETIGSYSYSLSSAVMAKSKLGEQLGLLWWDMAMRKFVGGATISSGGISVLEWDEHRIGDQFVGPSELNKISPPIDMGVPWSEDVWTGRLWDAPVVYATGQQGPSGPQGPVGPQGIAGISPQPQTYNLYSVTEWTHAHNLGYDPEVSVIDSDNNEVLVTVSYPDLNTVHIVFPALFTGKVSLL